MRPSRDDTLISVAYAISRRGTCARAQVGAVIAREGRILVTGYNGAPSGLPHCHHSKDEIKHRENYPSCTTAVHAEANAIAWAARHGVSLNDSELYTTVAPCLACAQLIVNAGITRVVFTHTYPNTAGVDLLAMAKNIEIDYQPR